MAQVYGVSAYAAAAKDVVRNYTSGAGGGLQFVANGTHGSLPQPGDVSRSTTRTASASSASSAGPAPTRAGPARCA